MRAAELIVAAVVVAAATTVAADGPAVWVGADACRPCHGSAATGDSYTPWARSRHAQAYAALSLPASREIARLSGTPGDPLHNPICLGCHSTAADTEAWQRDPGFHATDGVQCELCHGAGGAHADATARPRPRLDVPDAAFCLGCHREKGSHTEVLGARPFDVEKALAAIAHPRTGSSGEEVPAATPTPAALQAAAVPPEVIYKTPFNLAVSPDGRSLWIACEASGSLVEVATATRKVVAEIPVGALPHGVCLSPDGRRAFVANRGADTVSVVDTARRTVIATIDVGDEPHGLDTDATGSTLYVANAGSGDISVVDIASGHEVKRLAAGRGPWGVKRSADGRSVLVTNNLSHFVGFREPARSEVTVVGTGRGMVDNRIMIPDANLVQGVAPAPDGDFVLVTLMRTKNLVPMTRVLQGWVLTNGLGVLWRDGRVDQVLLDEPSAAFADPTDVAITPDGRFALVTGGGVDAVAVVDLHRLRTLLSGASDAERRDVLPNSLGVATELVVARIPVGRNPRGIAVAPDGRLAYVADALDDAVSVLDIARRERIATIPLGGPSEITLTRAGERIFHSAQVTFHGEFSCHSCHPDGGVDGLAYDIEPDGLGRNPVDNRSLRGILDTAPFKWTGKNPTLARQCGPRLAVFFTRIDPFTPDQVRALERYICTIPRTPNRHRRGDALTPAQRRGKAIFERTHSNSGALIPPAKRCVTCHRPPYYTDREQVSVGTGSPLDTNDVFDVPHLTNIYETAPYLHDGRAATLEEIWTRFNPEDKHGVTNDLTKDQLNDLVEYLKTL